MFVINALIIHNVWLIFIKKKVCFSIRDNENKINYPLLYHKDMKYQTKKFPEPIYTKKVFA